MKKRLNAPEILAPAGGMDSVYAAVRCGADAVYVGGEKFSARAFAANFTADEMKKAADYCHLHGVKIYRAMNTVIFDSEAEEFYNEVRLSAEAGIDGLIIQDIGAAAIARLAVPKLPLHASTQLTVHTPLGARSAARLGFCRVVPARELSLEAVKDIASMGLETEVFVHGAQCMCLSGQCYMSAVIGSRSANRGQCAQACRLPFSAKGKAFDAYALSLKDMSLLRHAAILAEAGVDSFKIEGRMKRPEYVAAAVCAFKSALSGTGDLAKSEARLEAVFSRSGFTDGYLTGRLGKNMFGFRRREDVNAAKSVLPELQRLYEKEKSSYSMSFHLSVTDGAPARLEFSCKGFSGEVTGELPEAAVNRSLTEDDAKRQLSKLGSTIYSPHSITCDIDKGVTLKASELNRMRREACRISDCMITDANTPKYEINRSPLFKPAKKTKESSDISLRLLSDSVENILPLADIAELIILPVSECERLCGDDIISKTAVSLPAFVTNEKRLAARTERLISRGFKHFICENFTHTGLLAAFENIYIHGGSGMNITNSYAAEECARLGFSDCTASFELRAAQIAAIKSNIPIGIAAYGRLPLMTVRNCPIKAQTGCGGCTHSLVDRTGRRFPVRCGEGYSVIYNCDILETSDKLSKFGGISFAVLDLSGLDAHNAENIVGRYRLRLPPEGKYTGGLYFRGVF